MGNNVFANGRELACKSGDGKVIAAFPDVCFTPPDKVPPTPPGVPIPYPLTSMGSDTDKGSKKVVISKKEVMKRDSSNFKKCVGDNAAQTAKKGMINSKLTGKVIFTSWSMDVKIEDKNVVRHLDTMTSNHSSPNANQANPWVHLDSSAPNVVTGDECEELRDKNKESRKELKENTKAKTLVGPEGKGQGTTVSSMSAGGTTGAAHSRKTASDRCDAFVEGGKMKDRRKGKSSLCKESGHQHGSKAHPNVQKSGHAEAKLLDELFKGSPAPGTVVTFNIDWKPKSGGKSKMPCYSCHKMMCAAEECGVKTYVCDKKNNPQKVPCTGDIGADQMSLKKMLKEL